MNGEELSLREQFAKTVTHQHKCSFSKNELGCHSKMCELCEAKPITKRYYEDSILWIANCSSHPNKKIIVLKRHTDQPEPWELGHMRRVAKQLFPDKTWRGPKSLPQHFHLHEQ